MLTFCFLSGNLEVILDVEFVILFPCEFQFSDVEQALGCGVRVRTERAQQLPAAKNSAVQSQA